MGSPATLYSQVVTREGSRDLLLELLDPIDISGTVEAIETSKFNFSCRLTTRGSNDKNEKLGQRDREGVT